jgi:DNA-binding NarL/FixJ family response regulator
VLGKRPTPKIKTCSCTARRPLLVCGAPTSSAVPSAMRLTSARGEVLCLLPGADDLEWLRGAAGKTRVVVSGAMRDIEDEIRDFMDRGGEVRVGDRVTPPMVVVDREIAFLPGRSHAHPEWGTVTRTPSVVESLVAVFEAHWGSAQVPGGDRFMSDQQYEVIVLLASGMTDEAVARKLDISPRTVQRHVHRIMELLGVRSRLELGIRLTKLGML